MSGRKFHNMLKKNCIRIHSTVVIFKIIFTKRKRMLNMQLKSALQWEIMFIQNTQNLTYFQKMLQFRFAMDKNRLCLEYIASNHSILC